MCPLTERFAVAFLLCFVAEQFFPNKRNQRQGAAAGFGSHVGRDNHSRFPFYFSTICLVVIMNLIVFDIHTAPLQPDGFTAAQTVIG